MTAGRRRRRSRMAEDKTGPGARRLVPETGGAENQARGLNPGLRFRIGQGWDSHALVADRRLILGGVEIPHDRGPAGHSDGDVLLHAICDAILGALGLGDIGTHFPPEEAEWRDAASILFIERAREMAAASGWRTGNLDTTVILAAPKLAPYRQTMREKIAAALGVAAEVVSVKAKTPEGMAGGENVAVAQAMVLMVRD